MKKEILERKDIRAATGKDFNLAGRDKLILIDPSS
jgi:hypothetical protein